MPRRDDAGIALGATVMAVLVISVLLSLMLRQTETLYSETVYRAEDDELLGATEAALDAYVSKYMITSTYPTAYVDQFERTRQCADGTQVIAGAANTCATWTYASTSSDADWSPISELLTGVDDSIEVAVEVLAGSGGQYEVRVTGRDGGGRKRTVSAVVGGRPLTDFARFVLDGGLDLDEDYWEGDITGHLYAGGGNISGGTGGDQVTVTKDFYANGQITNVTAASGAQGYNSTGNSSYGQFSDVFPTPITAATLWAGIENIEDVACDGTSRGLCLDATWWQGVVADTSGPSVPAGQPSWSAGMSWQSWRAALGFSDLEPDAIMLTIEDGAFAISVYQYPLYPSTPQLLDDCTQAITEEYWFHRAEPFWFWLQWDKWMNNGGGDSPANQFGQYWLTLDDAVDIDDFTEGVIWSEYPLIISHNLSDENNDLVNSSLTIAAGNQANPVDVHIWTDLQPRTGKVVGIVASGDIFVDRVGIEYDGSDFNEFLGMGTQDVLYPGRNSTHYSFTNIPAAYNATWGSAQRDNDENWDEELEIRAALLAMGAEGIKIANKCPNSNYNRSSSGGGDDDDGEVEFKGSAATLTDIFFFGGNDWIDDGGDEREYEYDSTLQGVQPPYFPLLGGASLVSAWSEQTVPAWAR